MMHLIHRRLTSSESQRGKHLLERVCIMSRLETQPSTAMWHLWLGETMGTLSLENAVLKIERRGDFIHLFGAGCSLAPHAEDCSGEGNPSSRAFFHLPPVGDDRSPLVLATLRVVEDGGLQRCLQSQQRRRPGPRQSPESSQCPPAQTCNLDKPLLLPLFTSLIHCCHNSDTIQLRFTASWSGPPLLGFVNLLSF